MIEIIFELSLTSENSIKEQTQTIQKANMLAQKIPEITMEVNKNISSITDTIQLLLKKVDEMNNLINKFKL
jgi:methyl-accepting chemotaxis protein